MTSANIYFFFDSQTLRILGHFMFQGTLEKVYLSDDGENVIFEIKDYHAINWGDLTPIREDGVLKVRTSYIIDRGCTGGFCGSDVELECGENPRICMMKKIHKIMSQVKEMEEEIQRQQKEESKRFEMIRNVYASIPLATSSKFKS